MKNKTVFAFEGYNKWLVDGEKGPTGDVYAQDSR